MVLRSILLLLAGALIGTGLLRFSSEIPRSGGGGDGDSTITRGTIADTTFRQGPFEVALKKQVWNVRPVLDGEGPSWVESDDAVWLRYRAHLSVKTDLAGDGDVALIPFRVAFLEFDGTGMVTGRRLAAARMRGDGRGSTWIFSEMAAGHGRNHWTNWGRHVGVELDTIRMVPAAGVAKSFAEDFPELVQPASAVRRLD